MNEFLTWEYLLTFAGCATGTALFTQFLKKIPFLEKLGAQFISYGVAFIILLIAQIATGSLTWHMVALNIFNAAVVSLSSNGAYDAVTTLADKVNSKGD